MTAPIIPVLPFGCARPVIETIQSWASASSPAPDATKSQAGIPGHLASPGANRLHRDLRPEVASSFGLRVFINRSRTRSNDAAVIITELPTPQEFVLLDVVRWKRWNAGPPARQHLDDIATQIKRVCLPTIPANRLAWFYHQPNQVAAERRDPHNPIDRIHLSALASPHGVIYLGFYVDPCSIQDLALAAGGAVEL